jgi:hypothetical protein
MATNRPFSCLILFPSNRVLVIYFNIDKNRSDYFMANQTHKAQTHKNDSSLNPLNLVEDFFNNNGWFTQRPADDELLAEANGRWDIYRFGFLWRDDLSALSYSCIAQLPSLRCPPRELFEIAARVNERLWIGHFDVSIEDPSFAYRYTLPIRQHMNTLHDQIEDLIETAFIECDRFFPAFNFVALGEKNPTEALVASVTETAGEA